ncbi:growth hormone receptor [Spea bombifrons]|uniref:growth hormone receptor n=1 Tax=Spea bombifrons TaxID=233779 RepID=UPI00234AB5F1|nr:growth hormone receptor [Spea bombifrons]
MDQLLFLVTLTLVCVEGSLFTGNGTSVKPSITECRPSQKETFTCYWTDGKLHNMSSQGLLKLQYRRRGDANWMDCPDTVSAGENSCYFSQTFTDVSKYYCLQLVSEDVIFDSHCISLDNIVRPDPPVALSWTVLTINSSHLYMDIRITWESPPSAQVEDGSTAQQYEVQYKEVNSTEWRVAGLTNATYIQIYSLKIGKEYLVRVQSVHSGSLDLAEFSDILHIPAVTMPDTSVPPSITECWSPQLETFTCYWTYGNFYHMSSPGLLKLQYRRWEHANWVDCPDTVSAGENSCYFNQTYTDVRRAYCLQLVGDGVIFDTRCLSVDEILRPDPPVALNWTLLNISASSLYMDIKVTWQPPPSADVKSGWILLHYEVQYKDVNSTEWTAAGLTHATYIQIYSLKIGKEYLVRVQSVHSGSLDLAEFSDILHIPAVTTPDTSVPPSITECWSPQLETFTCYWTYGNFYHMSSPGLLKLQYRRREHANWVDCPDTVSAGENSCYFNQTYTDVWRAYCLQLVGDGVIFDERCLSVDEILRPDPPVALNWTLLNISASSLYMDIKVTWQPPPSADVKSGWILLHYEVQYKDVNSTEWTAMSLVTTTYAPIYALKLGKEYLVRVRSKQHANEYFGEFSDILYIQALPIPEPEFPWLLFVIIGLSSVLVALMFIIFFKKDRLKVLILPPVPVPKIKGIDPDLLQKGKLDEVNYILANHESYKQELCIEDPWVEFIELDLDDAEDKTAGSDTDRLLGEEHMKSHNCLGVKDDDSGRASCCEPDIPETDFSNSDTCDGTSDTGQLQNTKENEVDLLCLNEKPTIGSPTNLHLPNTEDLSRNPDNDKMWPLLVNENKSTSIPASSQMKSKSSMDFYALVSDITPAGRLLLSPGQRTKTENEECREPPILHPVNLITDNAYICESAMTAFCAPNLPSPRESQPSMPPIAKDESYFTTESLNIAAMNFCPADKASSFPTDKASSYEMPVPDYTSVHIINCPQSLVLNTTVLPEKGRLAPCGYMSADQMSKVMP